MGRRMTYIKCPKCGREEPAFDYAHVCGTVQVQTKFSKQLRKFEQESGLEIFGLGAKRHIWEAALEKYAELIVRECCDILDPGEHQLIARFQARKWLEKHFGIDN